MREPPPQPNARVRRGVASGACKNTLTELPAGGKKVKQRGQTQFVWFEFKTATHAVQDDDDGGGSGDDADDGENDGEHAADDDDIAQNDDDDDGDDDDNDRGDDDGGNTKKREFQNLRFQT